MHEFLQSCAKAAEKDSETIFTELIFSIERIHSEVKELIRAQQRAAVSQAEGLVERLEQEIAHLKRRYAELEQLSHTEDHIHFFHVSCLPCCLMEVTHCLAWLFIVWFCLTNLSPSLFLFRVISLSPAPVYFQIYPAPLPLAVSTLVL